MSLVLYEDGKEFVVGNAQLPIEDLLELVESFANRTGVYDDISNSATLNRILFLYGTTFSQRENCIIGKLAVEITYKTAKVPLSQEEEEKVLAGEELESEANKGQSCFLHRETFINRKIPLNAILSV